METALCRNSWQTELRPRTQCYVSTTKARQYSQARSTCTQEFIEKWKSLCYGKGLNQNKNVVSRGDERGLPQIAKIFKRRKATVMLVYGTRGYCRRFRRGIAFPPLEHRRNSRAAKKTHTMVVLANSSSRNHQARQAGRQAASYSTNSENKSDPVIETTDRTGQRKLWVS
jgi:hypothetical protein